MGGNNTPLNVQSVENGKHLGILEGKMEALSQTISEMHDDVKHLVQRGERIKALEITSEDHKVRIAKLESGQDEISARFNKLYWTLGAVYSVISFITVMFGQEIKELFIK